MWLCGDPYAFSGWPPGGNPVASIYFTHGLLTMILERKDVIYSRTNIGLLVGLAISCFGKLHLTIRYIQGIIEETY